MSLRASNSRSRSVLSAASLRARSWSARTDRCAETSARRAGGGLLPLGGAGEEFSGYKGYGLGMMVEILAAVLPGAAFLTGVYPHDASGKPLPANLGHFFGAWRLDAFRPAAEIKATMDDLMRQLKNARKAEGASRIYIHGEKEFEQAGRRAVEGIALGAKVEASLRQIAADLGVEYNL